MRENFSEKGLRCEQTSAYVNLFVGDFLIRTFKMLDICKTVYLKLSNEKKSCSFSTNMDLLTDFILYIN